MGALWAHHTVARVLALAACAAQPLAGGGRLGFGRHPAAKPALGGEKRDRRAHPPPYAGKSARVVRQEVNENTENVFAKISPTGTQGT